MSLRGVSGQEYGEVVPLGDLDDEGFGGAFGVEVGGEFEAQEPGLAADDTVLAGVETGGALKDLDADLLLGGVFGTLTDSAGRDVE